MACKLFCKVLILLLLPCALIASVILNYEMLSGTLFNFYDNTYLYVSKIANLANSSHYPEESIQFSYRAVLESNEDDYGIPKISQFWTKRNKSCDAFAKDEVFDPDWDQWLQPPQGTTAIKDLTKIPNIVHFLWIAKTHVDLKLHQAISILSAHVNIRPDAIYFHTNNVPSGDHWDIVSKIPELRIIHRQPKKCVFGKPVRSQTSVQIRSDFERALILLEYGGIYLDLDVIALKPFNDFRRFPCTLGVVEESIICNCIIICHRHAPFLILWVDNFLEHFSDKWAVSGGRWPLALARKFPFLVHLQWKKFLEPTNREMESIWSLNLTEPPNDKWKDNYSVHLWNVAKQVYHYEYLNASQLWTADCVYAQISRDVINKARPLIGDVLGPNLPKTL